MAGTTVGTTTSYVHPSVGVCLRMFESRLNQATVSIQCLEIAALVFLAVIWLKALKRTPRDFTVLPWYSFGLALLFWLVHVIVVFVSFFLTECSFTFLFNESYRLTIVVQVFQWLALNFTLATVLLSIPHGLDRLCSPDPTIAAARSSAKWTLIARVLVGFVAIFTVIYLGLYIWAYQSSVYTLGALGTQGWVTADDVELLSAFPQYTSVRMALTTCWFLALLAGVATTALRFRAAARAWGTVPGSLTRWVVALCGALVAFGFLMTFFSFYNALGKFRVGTYYDVATNYLAQLFEIVSRVSSRFEFGDGKGGDDFDAYFTQVISELTLTTFFLLLTLLAMHKVARGVSRMLAHPEVYGFRAKESGTDEEVAQLN